MFVSKLLADIHQHEDTYFNGYPMALLQISEPGLASPHARKLAVGLI